MTREEWLAAYAALQPEQERVNEMFEDANVGDARFEDADSARFDLNERYTELAHAAAEIFGGLS
jgi:acyl carrier protein phosphodiesterase